MSVQYLINLLLWTWFKNIINDRMSLGKFFNFAEFLFSYL